MIQKHLYVHVHMQMSMCIQKLNHANISTVKIIFFHKIFMFLLLVLIVFFRYQKMLRSKDLCQKSDEDMNCVLGKRKKRNFEPDQEVCNKRTDDSQTQRNLFSQ